MRLNINQTKDKPDNRRKERGAVNRFLWFCVVMTITLILGTCFLVGWIHHEMSLEKNYQQQYGETWQEEFEKYHGTIEHARTQIAICGGSLLSIATVLIWYCLHTYFRKDRQKFTYHSV
jgi:hypothetical protein